MFNRLWRKLAALFHLNDRIVCEMSVGLGDADYHDYHDTVHKWADSFGELECERCGKKFRI